MIFTIVVLIFLEEILIFLGATETILPYAKSYAVIFILGAAINVFNITMNHIAPSEGAANISMIAMVLYSCHTCLTSCDRIERSDLLTSYC